MPIVNRLIALPVLLLCLCFAPPGDALAAPLDWSAPQPIDHDPPFKYPANLAVSCPSPSLCVGIDDLGNVMSSSNPTGGAATWTTVELRPSDATNGFTSLACPSVSLCVAVDGSGHVATSTDPTEGAGAWTIGHVDESVYFASVTCPSPALCLATGGNELDRNLAFSTNPAGGAGTWQAIDIGDGGAPKALACASANFCVAVEESGGLYTSANPTGGSAAWTKVNLTTSSTLDAVACPATDLCVIGTGTGIFTSTNPTGGAAAWTEAATGGIRRLACPSTTLCVGLRGDRIISSTDPTGGAGAWKVSDAPLPQGPSRTLSCPTTTFCVAAVGSSVVRSTNPSDTGSGAWTTDLVDPEGTTGLTSMACASSDLCLVGDEMGRVLVSTDPAGEPGTWSRIGLDPTALLPPQIKGIACPSTSFCAAVGGTSIYTSTDPTAAASWNEVEFFSHFFTGVACPTSSLCVAVDSSGNFVSSTDPTGGFGSWDSVMVDPDADGWSTIGGPTVACASASLCLGINYHSGNVASSTNPTGGAASWSLAALGEGLGGLSCPASSFCVVTGGYPAYKVWTASNPAGTAAAWSPSNLTSVAAMALSCPTTSFCAAGGFVTTEGNYNVAVTANPAGGGSTWKGTNTHPGYHGSNHTLSVECPSVELCLLGDPIGNLYVGTPSGEDEGGGGGPTPLPPGAPIANPPAMLPPPAGSKPRVRKRLKCRKGFRKQKVRGKARCVKRKAGRKPAGG